MGHSVWSAPLFSIGRKPFVFRLETVLLLPYPFCLFDEAAATGLFAISCCCLTDCKVTHFF